MGRKILLPIFLVAISGLIVFNIFLPKPQSFTVTTVPAAIPPAFAASISSVDSPDGTKTLVMKTVRGGAGNTYSFWVGNKEIFSKFVDYSITFSIPANTWSPDNRYVLLKETGNAGSVFFVLSGSVDASAQNDQTASITNVFATKHPDLKIQDATGWGGVNLVVFNTLKADGSRGPSFWFEMPSHAIIQLSSLF